MTITLNYNKSKKVYQCIGNDATIVWDALGLNTTFKVEDNLPVIVLPENVEKFTAKMKKKYNINVITQ